MNLKAITASTVVKPIPLSNETQLSDKFGFLALTDCGKYLIDKEGQLTAVILLHSNISEGLDRDRYNQLFNARKRAFEQMGDNYYFSINSIRKQKQIIEKSNIKHAVVKKLSDKWNEQFKNSYETKHYLVLTTKEQTLVSKTLAKHHTSNIDKLEAIDNKIVELMGQLHDYSLELLQHNDLISYWASLLNGRDIKVDVGHYLFDEYITDTNVFFPEKNNYFISSHNGQDTYSTFLSIKTFPKDTTSRLFSDLQKLSLEFNIYQYYHSHDLSTSIRLNKEKIDRLEKLRYFNQTHLLELSALNQRLENEEISLLTQVWNIQIFAKSTKALNARALEVQTLVDRRNLLLFRESANLEACFWARFPSHERLRIRKYKITSDNLPHFITFSSDNSGLNKNTWGDKPVCRFITNEGAIYNFSFHQTADREALGNTMVIGGSGQGKTTLISFLLSQCLKYKNFKCMAFDRGLGLKIFADVIKANYTDFSGTTQNINPLQMDEENKTFLQSWLTHLLARNNDEDIQAVAYALNQNYTLKKANRTLANMASAFGKQGQGTIRNALNVWLPEGANGAYFNGKTDALDFDKPLTFFDTTILLDNPEVLGAMAHYLFFRIKTKILNEPSPYAIFVDELNKYLSSEHFAPKLRETAAEIRKTNGILIMAVQSAKTIFENKTYQEMKDNISTYILYPNSKADSKYYVDEIGLNSAEFDWIKTTGGNREVMVKKSNAETVILNIDLSRLGIDLKVFNSSSQDVAAVKRLQRKYPNNWIEKYLEG